MYIYFSLLLAQYATWWTVVFTSSVASTISTEPLLMNIYRNVSAMVLYKNAQAKNKYFKIESLRSTWPHLTYLTLYNGLQRLVRT